MKKNEVRQQIKLTNQKLSRSEYPFNYQLFNILSVYSYIFQLVRYYFIDFPMLDSYSSDLLSSFQKIDRKKSTKKNIKESEINLNQIKKIQELNILPFSLKQQHNKIPNSHHITNLSENQSHNNPLEHSVASESFTNQFKSRKISSLGNQNKLKSSQDEQTTNFRKDLNQNQQNNQNVSNHILSGPQQFANMIQLQVHLTIAKKKYTLKLSYKDKINDLSQIVENFLIQNEITNPTKKSYLKTKTSIIQMVEKKIKQAEIQKNQNFVKNNQDLNNVSKDVLKESKLQKQTTKDHIQNQGNDINNEGCQQPVKTHLKRASNHFQNQKIAIKQNSRSSNSHQIQQEEGCSPSFKSSEYIPTKSLTNVISKFLPQPKHKENKYQNLIMNHYHNKINDNQKLTPKNMQIHQNKNRIGQQRAILSQNVPLTDSLNFDQNSMPSSSPKIAKKRTQQSPHFAQKPQKQQQQGAKSVYEKWKQRQKSKQMTSKKNHDRSFTNALKEKKLPQNSFTSVINEDLNKQKERETNWSTKPTNWPKQMPSNQSTDSKNKVISLNQMKGRQQKSRKKTKTHLEQQDSSLMHQQSQKSLYTLSHHNNRSAYKQQQDKSPNKFMNKTQVFNNRKTSSGFDQQIFSPNRHIRNVTEHERSVTPVKVERSTKKLKTSIENQNLSKVYTINDQQYPINQQVQHISPDHFYKQGLVFEAKKQQEIKQKFNSLYPFTTRNQQLQTQALQNNKPKISTKNAEPKSKDKYFSSKLTTNNNTKSYSNIVVLDEKEKSALHQRLYNQNKAKKTKFATLQVSKIFKIAKPEPEAHIKLMQENLNQIKGLSQQNKIKLIERNLELKEKIKEKDRLIDEELDKMIKEGKVKPTCQLVHVKKSPFRKTKLY